MVCRAVFDPLRGYPTPLHPLHTRKTPGNRVPLEFLQSCPALVPRWDQRLQASAISLRYIWHILITSGTHLIVFPRYCGNARIYSTSLPFAIAFPPADYVRLFRSLRSLRSLPTHPAVPGIIAGILSARTLNSV